MNTFIAFFICVLVSVSALPLDIYKDTNGQEFVIIRVNRIKRSVCTLPGEKADDKDCSSQAKWGINQSGYGVVQKGNLFENKDHKVDASLSASKAWDSHGLKPDTYGGQVDYHYKPDGSNAFIKVDSSPGFGTDVNAGAKYNFAGGKNWGADVTGQYGRHYGGEGGTGKPQAGVFVNVAAKI